VWCRWRVWAVAALLSLGACSENTLVYKRLNFLLPWYVSAYVDLNQPQKVYLDELLVPFLAWHRSQELPAYLKVLELIEDSLKLPSTPEGVAAIATRFEKAGLRLQDKALDWLLDLGTGLTEAQVKGFLEEMWKRQHEYEEKYLERTDQEFYTDNYDNLRDYSQDYLGRLSDQQRELLRDASRRLLRSDRAWLKDRADWLTQLATVLQRQPGWQERVRAQVAARNEDIPPDFQRIYEHNMSVIYATIAQLLNGRSAQQDRHLRDKLAGLRGDIEALIAQGGA
jgi:Family of unknown function (DUF6279)